jgi:hypothetical protein
MLRRKPPMRATCSASREAEPRRLGTGDTRRFVGFGSQLQAARHRLVEASRERPSQAPRRPGASVRASSPSSAHGAAAAISSAAARAAAPTPLMQPLPPRQAPPAPALMHALRRLAAGQHCFTHGMLGTHHDRTQGRRCLVVKALPEHRQAEESGRTESLDRRIDFFEVASRAFLAVVHAEHELRRPACRQRMGAAVVGLQRGQNLPPVMVLVGQQPDLAALLASSESAQRSSACGALRPERAQFAATKPETLGQDEQRPGRQGGCAARCPPRRRCGASARRTANCRQPL